MFVHTFTGNSLVGADHHRAVSVLKDTGNIITMCVARETLLPSKMASVSTTGFLQLLKPLSVTCENV